MKPRTRSRIAVSIGSNQPVLSSLDFQVQRPDTKLGRSRQCECDHFPAKPAATRRLDQIKIINESIQAAILDTEAKCDDEISNGLVTIHE